MSEEEIISSHEEYPSKLQFDNDGTTIPWSSATELINSSLVFPNIFSATVKRLNRCANLEKSLNQKVVGDFYLKGILFNLNFRSKFLFSLRTLEERKQIANKLNENDLTGDYLVNLYDERSAATITMIIFLYAQIKDKLAKHEDKCSLITKNIQEHCDLSFAVSQEIPSVNLYEAVIAGTLKSFAYAFLYVNFSKDFLDYQNHLKKFNLPYDFQKEQKLFSTTNAECSAVLLQKFGFPLTFVQDFYLALDRRIKNVPEPARRLRSLINLIENLKNTGKLPNADKSLQNGTVDYKILEKSAFDMSELEAEAQKLNNLGSYHSWLSKEEGDLLDSDAPDLFSDQKLEFFIAHLAQSEKLPSYELDEFRFETYDSLLKAVDDFIVGSK
jgi:hypothetical protein